MVSSRHLHHCILGSIPGLGTYVPQAGKKKNSLEYFKIVVPFLLSGSMRDFFSPVFTIGTCWVELRKVPGPSDDWVPLEFFFFCLFAFSRSALAAYGGFQARGPIGAVAASLCQNHSNARSEPCLQPTPQLTAMPDP